MTADTLAAPPPAEAVAAALAALGSGPDAVAESLRAAGARGRPCHVCGCPVAVYLRGRLPGLSGAVVGSGLVVYGSAGVAALPLAVRAFQTAFDGGAYPDLDATTAEGQ